MSNTITVIALIVSKTSTSSIYVNGTATYRPNSGKYKEFDFKLFSDGNNRDIHPFEEDDLVMMSGKFTYHKGQEPNPMFVCL